MKLTSCSCMFLPNSNSQRIEVHHWYKYKLVPTFEMEELFLQHEIRSFLALFQHLSISVIKIFKIISADRSKAEMGMFYLRNINKKIN